MTKSPYVKGVELLLSQSPHSRREMASKLIEVLPDCDEKLFLTQTLASGKEPSVEAITEILIVAFRSIEPAIVGFYSGEGKP